MPISIFVAADDTICAPTLGYKLAERLPNLVSNFTVPEGDHKFIFKNYDIFNEQLLKELSTPEGDSIPEDETENKSDSAILTTAVSSLLLMAFYITASVF